MKKMIKSQLNWQENCYVWNPIEGEENLDTYIPPGSKEEMEAWSEEFHLTSPTLAVHLKFGISKLGLVDSTLPFIILPR